MDHPPVKSLVGPDTSASSWFSAKAVKRTSRIAGHGLLALAPIRAGEIVAVKGGAIMTGAALGQVSPAEIQLEDDLYIAPRSAAEVEANILCLNHSCRPNVGVRGQITLVAMRDVAAGAELTLDYAMIDGNPDERMTLYLRRARLPQDRHRR